MGCGCSGHARGRTRRGETRADEVLAALRRECEQQRGVCMHLVHGTNRRSAVLEWSARLGGRYDGRVNQEAAQNLAETDADGARALTAPGVGSIAYILQRLAEQFAPEDRAKALKFAEEAAVQARDGTARPRRRDGEGRWLAGGPGTQGGRARVVNEAAEAATRMGFESRQAYAGQRCGGAGALRCRAAPALVEPMKDEKDRDRYLGFIATALAESDPKRAPRSFKRSVSGRARRSRCEWRLSMRSALPAGPTRRCR